MLSLKPNVRIFGLRPELIVALLVVQLAFSELGYDCIITTALDGVHSVGSEHYNGLALDFRTKHVPGSVIYGLRQRIADSLGADFDVLYEGAGSDNAHLHVEFDPKQPY
jgi:hypothetical protein